jgi:hypothetical protein
MKQHEIIVGHHYVAKVSNKLTIVRVDEIRLMGTCTRYPRLCYDVTNLTTRHKINFRSAQRFRRRAHLADGDK